MSADATDILAAVSAELLDLYPAAKVYTAKRPVAGNKPPNGGWNAGWDATNGAFILSLLDAEEVDTGGDFESVTVAYGVLVEYAFNSFAKTASGDNPMLNEDSRFRDVRQAVRRRLYSPKLGSLPVFNNVRSKPRPVYEFSGTGGAPVTISGQTFYWEVSEARKE